MPRVIELEYRRRDIVATPPDFHLCLAVLLDRLRLVESLQGAVVPLVEPPRALDGNPHAIHLVEQDPQRADRPLQHRGKGDVDRELFLQQLAPRLGRLFTALIGQVDVVPAREQVFHVPDALSVAHENQFSRHRSNL